MFELTDVSGPRLTGSTGLQRAQEWSLGKLKEWGLTNTALEPWGGFGKGWENQKCYVAMTAPYYQPLIAVPKAWTPGTQGPLNAEVVLLKLEKAEDMARVRGKVRGKIVLLAPASTEIRPGFKPDA